MKRLASLIFGFLLTLSYAFAQTGSPSWTSPGPSSGIGYPQGAVPFTLVATGTTTATLTITPPSGRLIYVCGFTASELAGTGQTTIGSITNLFSTAGAVTASFWFPGTPGATVGLTFFEDLIPCVPSVSGQNVVVTTPVATAATSSALYVVGYYY